MMSVSMDEILLRLEKDVRANPDPLALFKDAEADRVLEGIVRYRRQPTFICICQDLGLTAPEIGRMVDRVLWRG
jgi:hypothetical protein